MRRLDRMSLLLGTTMLMDRCRNIPFALPIFRRRIANRRAVLRSLQRLPAVVQMGQDEEDVGREGGFPGRGHGEAEDLGGAVVGNGDFGSPGCACAVDV